MTKRIFLTVQSNIVANLILFSFLLFWLRAIDFKINSSSLALLYVGLLINIPLCLAFSPKGILHLKRLFAKRYGFPVFAFYLIFTAFHCCCLIIHQLDLSNTQLPYPLVALALMAFDLWFPLCALLLGYVFFRNTSDPVIDWKVILFLAIALSFSKVGGWLTKFYFKAGIISRYYHLWLLKFNVANYHGHYLQLREIWCLLIPILIILMSAISHKTINLGQPWNRRTTRICLYFAVFILLRDLIALYFGKISLAVSSWLWDLATGFYPQPVKWALLEEVLFRGILQTYLSAKLSSLRYGELIAVLLSSIIFGIYHYPFISTSWYQAAVIGIIFGWAYSKTQNLWVPVALHGFNNLLLYSIFVK